MVDVIGILSASISPTPLLANRTAYAGGNCVIYEITQTLNDGVKSEWQIKTTTVTDTMADGLALEAKMDAALCTVGDNPLTDRVTTGARTGGGWTNDGDKHIRFGYYRFTRME